MILTFSIRSQLSDIEIYNKVVNGLVVSQTFSVLSLAQGIVLEKVVDRLSRRSLCLSLSLSLSLSFSLSLSLSLCLLLSGPFS